MGMEGGGFTWGSLGHKCTQVTRTLPHTTHNPRQGVVGGMHKPQRHPRHPQGAISPLAVAVTMVGGDGNGGRQWPHMGNVGV